MLSDGFFNPGGWKEGEGVHLKLHLQGCAAGKTAFSSSFSRSTKPSFQDFSVPQDPHFNQKSKNFPIFCSKCLNLVNFQFLNIKSAKIQFWKPHLGQKSVLKATFLSKKKKKQFSKPPNLVLIHSTSPHFGPFRMLTHTETKVEYPFRVPHGRILQHEWGRIMVKS